MMFFQQKATAIARPFLRQTQLSEVVRQGYARIHIGEKI